MKRQIIHVTLPICATIVVAGAWWASAGDLNPPPGPIMATDRVTLNEQSITLPFTITQPGSYVLTSNFTGVSGQSGIFIDADDVTLDMNGFALIGVAGSFDGINVSATHTNLAIRNGTIRNWGGDGVDASIATNSQLENLRASGNGAIGLKVGVGGTVTNCTVTGNTLDGIDAGIGSTVVDCSVANNLRNGIAARLGSTVSHCTVYSNDSIGIITQNGCTVIGCTAYENGGDGINAFTGSSVIDCTADNNGGDGIRAFNQCTVRNCTVSNNTAGIHAVSSDNRIQGNHVTGNDRGLDIDSGGNYVANNTVKGNTDNYDIAAGNQLNILLCEIPESIDWPAMVTLAGSLTGTNGQNGITVNADDVTIDLGGHALIGVAGSLDGVNVFVSRKNLAVRNGTVRDWGGDGVDAGKAQNSQLENLRASGNGADGLRVGDGSTITNCTALSNGDDGIFADSGSTVTNCTVRGNGDDGIFGDGRNTVTNCTASLNTGDGIQVRSDSRVVGNNCHSNGFGGGDGAGIHATGADNRIEGNNVTDNDRGIDVDFGGNIIIKNTASGNGVNYSIVASNSVGAILNVAGAVIATTNPWRNFEY